MSERPKIPEIGTAEGRKRLRKSGVPLDEWVLADWDSPEARRRLAAEQRQYRRRERIVWWFIGLALAGSAVWTATTSDGPPVDPDAYQGIDTSYPR